MAIGGGTAVAAPATGHAAAVAEAKALLAEAPILGGATRSDSAPVKSLRRSPQFAGYTTLVQRKAYWTIDESWKKAYAALTSTVPSGLTAAGSGSTGGPKPGDRLRYAVDEASPLPAGIAYAALILAVAPDGHGKAAIAVFAQAVAQPPRPGAENVPRSVHRAHLYLHTRYGHHIRAHTVTGAAAAQLIKDFDALTVAAPAILFCPADFGRNDVIRFRFDGHTLVATTGVCGMVAVTRDGKQLPPLSESTAFLHDVHTDLAPAKHSGHRKTTPA
jgi:hypothetical protein